MRRDTIFPISIFIYKCNGTHSSRTHLIIILILDWIEELNYSLVQNVYFIDYGTPAQPHIYDYYTYFHLWTYFRAFAYNMSVFYCLFCRLDVTYYANVLHLQPLFCCRCWVRTYECVCKIYRIYKRVIHFYCLVHLHEYIIRKPKFYYSNCHVKAAVDLFPSHFFF